MKFDRQMARMQRGENGHGRATVSVILPVLNEEGSINEIISHLLELRSFGNSEIIVVDGDLKGGTISSISEGGIITAIAGAGRSRQMNHGASLASGEILLFLHADTFLPPDALSRIRTAMDGPFVAGAFSLGIRSERSLFRITEKYVALRTHLTRIPFGDQAIFIRKSYFDEIGGFSDTPLMEDIDIMKRIRRRGHDIAIIPDKVMTSARRWEREGILRCTLRNWALQLSYALGVKAERLARWYKP